MRILMFLAACASLGACKWTDFDDLEGQTWVDSTEKPDVKSSDYGVAIQRGADAGESGSGGTLAVIAVPGAYSELAYDAAGSSSLRTGNFVLATKGVMTLDATPIFLASPTSSEVALVTTGDAGSIAVATGTHTLELRPLSLGDTTLGTAATIASTPDAATYLQPDPFPGIADPPGPEPLVAVGDVVLGTVYGLPPSTPQPACQLTDGTTALQIRALGTVSNGATDDVLVWNGTDGKLLRYSGSVFNGCMTAVPLAATPPADTPAFHPGHGSRILTIDATHVLLAGQEDLATGRGSFLQVYDTTALTPVGNPIAIDGMRSAAILETSGGRYAVAGFPDATVDRKTGGQVLVFEITAQGLASAAPAAILRDAQPENGERFGRSVAALPFNGQQVIAVAADNEIFVYFRANRTDGTALYDETRQGR